MICIVAHSRNLAAKLLPVSGEPQEVINRTNGPRPSILNYLRIGYCPSSLPEA